MPKILWFTRPQPSGVRSAYQVLPAVAAAPPQSPYIIFPTRGVRRGVVLGCALDFPRPLGGLRSLGEGWWRRLGGVSAGEALGT